MIHAGNKKTCNTVKEEKKNVIMFVVSFPLSQIFQAFPPHWQPTFFNIPKELWDVRSLTELAHLFAQSNQDSYSWYLYAYSSLKRFLGVEKLKIYSIWSIKKQLCHIRNAKHTNESYIKHYLKLTNTDYVPHSKICKFHWHKFKKKS